MRRVSRPISNSSAASTRCTASGSGGARSDTMPKLIPVPDASSKPFWDAVNERRLVLQFCTSCNRLQYPPQQACQICNSVAGLTWKEVQGKGHIAAFIVIEDGRLNRRMPDQPYNLAMVTLEEVTPGQLIHEWRVVA